MGLVYKQNFYYSTDFKIIVSFADFVKEYVKFKCANPDRCQQIMLENPDFRLSMSKISIIPDQLNARLIAATLGSWMSKDCSRFY